MTTMPCRDCGRSITNPTTRERLTVFGRPARNGVVTSQREQPLPMDVTTCTECASRQERARVLLEAHPLARQPLGSLSYALDIASDALIALELLRVKPTQQKALAITDLDVAMLLAHLGRTGSARYSERPLPTIDIEGENGSRRPWDHVTDDRYQALRNAYASLLHARVEQPKDIPAPADGAPACLLCGVATVPALPSRSKSAWGPLFRADPAVLGGAPAPKPVVGHICPTCTRGASEEVPRAGATPAVVLGRTALERALFSYLGIAAPPWQEWSLPTVKAWAALRPGTPPNATPWAHEPLERLAKELKR